jgi:ADP-heptose:LPS heptosyltransferase
VTEANGSPMAPSILRKLLGRAGANDAPQGESFSLPRQLAAGSRVLLVGSGDLTDILFATPLIEALRSQIDGIHLGLVCDERAAQLVLSTEFFDDAIVVEEDQLQPEAESGDELASVLTEDEWDAAILLTSRPDPLRDRLAGLSRARLRLGPGHEQAFPNLNCEVRPPGGNGYPYERTRTWTQLLGLSPVEGGLRWSPDEKRERQVAQLIHFNKPRKEQKLIGIDPGVGKSGARIATGSLALIADHISRSIPSKTMVLTADPDEILVEEFEGMLSQPPLDLARPTLLEVTLFLCQCELFLCSNTDLMHFAVAMGIPTVAFFTPEDEASWIPDRADHLRIIRPEAGADLDLADLMERVAGALSA